MSNSTPSTPPEDEQTREQAEAALREHGWNPITPYQLWESELAVGRSADDAFEVSLWNNPDTKAGTPWICDVGVTSSGSQKESLWILGIPRPEEAPALLERHADILSVGYGGRRLDLATGTVFVDGRTRVAEIVAAAQNGIAEREEILREMVGAGWELDYAGMALSGSVYVHRLGATGTRSDLDSFGAPSSLWLHVNFWLGGISEIYVEDPGHGIAIPISKEKIPTPDEAYEAYYGKFSWNKIVTREYRAYEPRRTEGATR